MSPERRPKEHYTYRDSFGVDVNQQPGISSSLHTKCGRREAPGTLPRGKMSRLRAYFIHWAIGAVKATSHDVSIYIKQYRTPANNTCMFFMSSPIAVHRFTQKQELSTIFSLQQLRMIIDRHSLPEHPSVQCLDGIKSKKPQSSIVCSRHYGLSPAQSRFVRFSTTRCQTALHLSAASVPCTKIVCCRIAWISSAVAPALQAPLRCE